MWKSFVRSKLPMRGTTLVRRNQAAERPIPIKKPIGTKKYPSGPYIFLVRDQEKASWFCVVCRGSQISSRKVGKQESTTIGLKGWQLTTS